MVQNFKNDIVDRLCQPEAHGTIEDRIIELQMLVEFIPPIWLFTVLYSVILFKEELTAIMDYEII